MTTRRSFVLASASALLLLGCDVEGPGEVDVRERGAAGDGATDDSDVLEQAIAESASGVVILPAGTYRVRRTLAVPGEVTLRGEGVGRTIVVFDGPAVQMASAPGAVIVLERLTVRGGEPFAA